MRQLKFRAWDKKENKWLLGYEKLGGFGLFGECIVLDEWARTVSEYIFKRNGKDIDDLIVMQFTGLLDKNGKEIYEGDVVRILYSDLGSKSHYDPRTLEQYLKDIAEIKIVIWSEQGFYVSNKINGYAETIECGEHGYVEVIGNIYEHPRA